MLSCKQATDKTGSMASDLVKKIRRMSITQQHIAENLEASFTHTGKLHLQQYLKTFHTHTHSGKLHLQQYLKTFHTHTHNYTVCNAHFIQHTAYSTLCISHCTTNSITLVALFANKHSTMHTVEQHEKCAAYSTTGAINPVESKQYTIYIYILYIVHNVCGTYCQ